MPCLSAGSATPPVKRLRSGALRTTNTRSGALRPRSIAASPIALVGGDDDVGEPIGQPLERDHAAVEEILSAPEARQVELGHQVVLIEDHPRAAELERQRDQEQQVGRVADVDDVEAAEAAREPPGAPERRRVLAQVAGRRRRSPRSAGSGGSRSRRSARTARGPACSPCGQIDRDLVAGVAQRLALLPDAPVERNREVLDDDERPTRRHRGTRPCVRARRCRAAGPGR